VFFLDNRGQKIPRPLIYRFRFIQNRKGDVMIEIMHSNILKLTNMREEAKPGDTVETGPVPIAFKRP
jgi:hypothetical protein